MNDTHHNAEQHQHLSARFDTELQELKGRVLKMGHVVDAQVTAAIAAFVRRDAAAASRVVAGDHEVNGLEREIDERCVRLLALQQPAASDLRFIAAVLKIVTDLERIGDFAVSIAENVASLDPLRVRAEQDLSGLAEAALTVLRSGLEAFVQRNVDEAQAATTADRPVKAWVLRLASEIRDSIQRDPKLLQNALAILLVTKHIERVAEHATNLAEMAIYTERGEDVRHLAHR
ncbi:MAG TPA: phosphate signaling complex protein PhoU [Polyangiaceae bacterium]|nr:phosphate signaling complex protein PhoU [Polyangiaceae bacterium]